VPLALRHIYKNYGDLRVLEDLTLEVEGNRLICILGPSGCGKTTLLNLVAGIIRPDRGELIGLAGKQVSYLFQDTRLLKWKTVRGNIDFVLKDRMTPARRREVVDRYLAMVELTDFQDYYPDKLSGGMKQRVAIARAFAYPADILLMDEPFAALDLSLKLTLISSFIRLWLVDRRTVFFVTHSIEDALLLGDDIFVLTERPARVKKHVLVDIPHLERDLQDERMVQLERRLYGMLTGHPPLVRPEATPAGAGQIPGKDKR